MEAQGPRILEIKRRLDGSREQFDCQACLVRPGRHAAVLYQIDRDWHFPQVGLTVPAGSLSTGFFWEAKPFNLYHWMTPWGETIGDYFNLAAETRITTRTIEWLDLVLDLCLLPGGGLIWLDEDELVEDLAPGIKLLIRQSKRMLQKQAAPIARHLGWLSSNFWSTLKLSS